MTEDKEVKKVKELAQAVKTVGEHYGTIEISPEMGLIVRALLKVIQCRPDMEEPIMYALKEIVESIVDTHNRIVLVELVLGKDLTFKEWMAGPPKGKPGKL
jgi:hypothetical protein